MFTIYAFGILLVLLAATMLVSHWRAWSATKQHDDVSEDELRFAWRQCRRRCQTSAMIGLVGVGICLYRIVLIPRDGVLAAVYLAAMVLVVAWIALLAIADAIDTRQHFRRLRRSHLSAHARLAAEILQQDGESD